MSHCPRHFWGLWGWDCFGWRLAQVWILGIALLAPGLGSCVSSSSKKTDSSQKKKSKSKQKFKKSGNKKKDAAASEAAYQEAIDAAAAGNTRLAKTYYKRSLMFNAKHRRANQRYVHLLLEEKENKKALRVAKKFRDEVPGKALGFHTLADAEMANGQHDKAIGTMSALLAFSEEDASAFEKRGRARLTVGENKAGLKDLRKALSMEPDNSVFMLSLGGAFLRVGKHEDALVLLKRANKEEPADVKTLLWLGIAYRNKGKTKDAIKTHRKAIGIAPDNARAHYELAIGLNLDDDNPGAEKHFGKAIDADSKKGIYWYGYADLLRLMGRTEEAAAAYRRSVHLAPANSMAWQRLGETLLATEQFEDMSEQLEVGTSTVDTPILYFLLAQAYDALGNTQAALSALESYFEASPTNRKERKEAKKLERRLRRH